MIFNPQNVSGQHAITPLNLKPTKGQLALGDSSAKSRTKKEHLARYEFAKKYVENKDVLDSACGIGYGSEMLCKAGARSVVGVDCSIESIAYVNMHYNHIGISTVVADVQTYTKENSFDVVVSFETIEHVANYRQTLKNFYDSLRPGGMLILSTPNRPVISPSSESHFSHIPDNPAHVHEFTINEIAKEVEGVGFKSIELYAQCRPLKFNNRILQKLNRIYQRFSSQYSAEVKPMSKVGIVKYIILTAKK